MKSIVFAKRNIKEYLRSPLMLFFTIMFPLIMFFVFQLIKLGTGASDDMVPMFAIQNIVPSICIFSFSFVSLTLSTQIAKDIELSFQTRLRVSPMKGRDFFLGYFYPSIFITIIQAILCYTIGVIYGMQVGFDLILSLLSAICISVFYISIGILLGSMFNEKSCGGISSILVNATAIFSGMFFPLSDGLFKDILSILPFLPSVAVPQAILSDSTSNILLYIVIICFYITITSVIAILVFNKKLRK